jgi:hypothetical protein
MKYLIDSLQSYESGHGNALHPICAEPDKSFMGDHIAMQTVTAEEFREMKRSVDRKLDSFIGEINSRISMTDQLARVSLTTTPSVRTHVNLGPVRNTQRRAIHRTTSAPYLLASPIEEPASGNSSDAEPRSRSRQIPIAGVHIPDIGRGCGGWRKAIEQWEHGTPNMPQGLALKDWPKEWHTKGMATVMGVKRSQRKLVADEYARSVQNPFTHVYKTNYSCR